MKGFFTRTTRMEDFTDLYDRYVDMIYRFVYFKVPSKEEAQDITSDVFSDLYKYLKKRHKVSNCQAFLYRCARNKVIDYYRTRKDELNIDDFQEISDTDQGDGLDEQIAITFDLEVVQQTMQSLPQTYQDIIILRYVEGYTVQETAKILKKSEGATRTLSHRALKALQQCLKNSQNN